MKPLWYSVFRKLKTGFQMRALVFVLQAALLAWLVSSCCCFGGLYEGDDEVDIWNVHGEGGGGDV